LASARFRSDAARDFSLTVYLRFGLADAVGDSGFGEEGGFGVRDSKFAEDDGPPLWESRTPKPEPPLPEPAAAGCWASGCALSFRPACTCSASSSTVAAVTPRPLGLHSISTARHRRAANFLPWWRHRRLVFLSLSAVGIPPLQGAIHRPRMCTRRRLGIGLASERASLS